jgi:rubrerythrin
MKHETRIGMNRTGADMSPEGTRELRQATIEFPPDLPGDDQAIQRVRIERDRESPPVGTVPIPGMKKLAGRSPEVFIDKLGERLGFERTGVRLYDALIAKGEAHGLGGSAVTLDRLKQFRTEEARHMAMLWACLREIGADPTAMTPSADIGGVASEGLMQVITDARTSVADSVHAILVAELADHDAWQLLIQLAQDVGMDEMADRFRPALDEEREHLSGIRQLYQELIRGQARAA